MACDTLTTHIRDANSNSASPSDPVRLSCHAEARRDLGIGHADDRDLDVQ